MIEGENSKIFLRSRILKEIADFRDDVNLPNEKIERAISNLLKIDDKITLTKVILKEMTGKNPNFDTFLGIVLISCANSACTDIIFQNLISKDTPDSVKIHLINVLRELNSNLKYADLIQYIDNIDDLTDFETQKFIESAKISPESQIDFLDFFYAVDSDDKTELLNSLSADFKGDELANIIALLIYQNKDLSVLKKCVGILRMTKSPLSYKPLNFILENFTDEALLNLVKTVINEFKIAKTDENSAYREIYTNLLKNSMPFECFASQIDGQSNFVLFFSRKKEDNTYQAFSSVLNLKGNVIACFGVDDISFNEYKTFFKKIFYGTSEIKIDFSVAAKILEEISKKALKNGNEIPYEFFVWNQLLLDIKPIDIPVRDYFSHQFEDKKISEFEFKNLMRADFMKKWFIKYNENEAFNALINEILNLKSYEEIINTANCFKDKVFEDIPIDLMLLYQACFMKIKEDKNADILFSLIKNSEFKEKMLQKILTKSIFEHFLTECAISKEDNVFLNKKNDSENVNRIFNLIKDKM